MNLNKIIIYQVFILFAFLSYATAKTNLLALIPFESQFQTVLEGIRSELGSEYSITAVDMKKSPDAVDIITQCKQLNPEALILMDTKAINLALGLQKMDALFVKIPKFVDMTLMVETTTKGLSNVAGIKFEVPIYTLVTNFRIISKKDFSKVGIFYRESFSSSIEEAKKHLSREQLSIDALCIDCKNNEKTTSKEALSTMKDSFDKMKNDNVDVFLLLADNLVVNAASLNEFWISKVKNKKIPMIATIDMLASSKFGVAVFTADPDLVQLGSQSANQIIEHFENETPMNEIGFEPTISIKSTLNAEIAKYMNWELKEEKLGRINNIIK